MRTLKATLRQFFSSPTSTLPMFIQETKLSEFQHFSIATATKKQRRKSNKLITATSFKVSGPNLVTRQLFLNGVWLSVD